MLHYACKGGDNFYTCSTKSACMGNVEYGKTFIILSFALRRVPVQYIHCCYLENHIIYAILFILHTICERVCVLFPPMWEQERERASEMYVSPYDCLVLAFANFPQPTYSHHIHPHLVDWNETTSTIHSTSFAAPVAPFRRSGPNVK